MNAYWSHFQRLAAHSVNLQEQATLSCGALPKHFPPVVHLDISKKGIAQREKDQPAFSLICSPNYVRMVPDHKVECIQQFLSQLYFLRLGQWKVFLAPVDAKDHELVRGPQFAGLLRQEFGIA